MEQVAAGSAQLLGALLQSAALPGVRQETAAAAQEGALAAAQAAAVRQLSGLQQRQRQLSSSSAARTARASFSELCPTGDPGPADEAEDAAPCPVSPRSAQAAAEHPAARAGGAEETEGTRQSEAAAAEAAGAAGGDAAAEACTTAGGGSGGSGEACGSGDPEWAETPGGLPGGAGLPGTVLHPRLQAPLTAVTEPDLALELCTLLMLMGHLRPGGALPALRQLPRQEREQLMVYALFLFLAAGSLRTRSRRQLMKRLLARQRQPRRGGRRQLRDHPDAAFHEAMLGG